MVALKPFLILATVIQGVGCNALQRSMLKPGSLIVRHRIK
jgi:hypothetical protein